MNSGVNNIPFVDQIGPLLANELPYCFKQIKLE
ncbi:Uncharacterised protein [Legionella lansingensis]|nr:Uncharacterised protein [Legionella lansingensis]